MNIHLKIRELVNEKGPDFITNTELVTELDKGHVFTDETAQYKKILYDIINSESRYAQKLLDLGAYTSRDVSYLVSQYADKNLMKEYSSSVRYIFDCLAYGLGWIDDSMLVAESKSELDKSLHVLLRRYVRQEGAEIILSKTIVGKLDDNQVFSDEFAPYKKLLRDIINEGYAQKFLKMGSYTSKKVSSLASQYAQKELKNKSDVLYVFDNLAYGLGWIDWEPSIHNYVSYESLYNLVLTINKMLLILKNAFLFQKRIASVLKIFTYIINAIRLTIISFAKWVKKSLLFITRSIFSMSSTLLKWGKKLILFIFSVIKICVIGCKEMIAGDLKWFKEKCGDIVFPISCAIFIASLVAILIGWFNDIGHAPVWTWLFWESTIVGVVSLFACIRD